MGLTSTIELEGPLAAHRDSVSFAPGGTDQISVLSAWMVSLGAIRVACAIASYAMAALQAWRLPGTSSGRWTWFFDENQPILLVSSAWPLILGLLLRRTRWPEWLKAGALTFSILSVGGVLSMIADWSDGRHRWINVGSFSIAREAIVGLGIPVLLGAIQLLLEFATAARAGLMAVRTQDAAAIDPDRQARARRARFGRVGLVLSLAFLVLMVRLPAWSAYLEMINQSKWVREFILRDDLRRIHANRPSQTPGPDAVRVHEMEILLAEASQAWHSEKYERSRDGFKRVIAEAEAIPLSTLTPQARQSIARAFNGWAWLLATCPEEKFRDPQDAVAYARRAVDLSPTDRQIWNTLGVAYFRLGKWEESRNALYRSMELSDEGDAFDWFFLAMIHAHFKHEDRAHDWYDKSVQWSHQRLPGDGELYRFQVEAAKMLGLPMPERIPTPSPAKATRPPGYPLHPGGLRRGRGQGFNPTPAVE